MRNAILIISGLIVFALINMGIYQKQQILQTGDTILLQLAPVDPRSLMQGDFMSLRYSLEDELKENVSLLKNSGFIVLKPDEENVAHFVRVYHGETLANNEKLIKYHYNIYPSKIIIRPDSFLFQEGRQALYQKAKYAIFHYYGNKDYLLIGVADAQHKQIKPGEP
jgi:uncharacterized membrane-anchored protein